MGWISVRDVIAAMVGIGCLSGYGHVQIQRKGFEALNFRTLTVLDTGRYLSRHPEPLSPNHWPPSLSPTRKPAVRSN